MLMVKAHEVRMPIARLFISWRKLPACVHGIWHGRRMFGRRMRCTKVIYFVQLRGLTLTIRIMTPGRQLKRMLDKLNRYFAAQVGAPHASHAGPRLHAAAPCTTSEPIQGAYSCN